MTLHSNLGASSAERWMNCPGSVNLIESLPFKPPSGPYAQEGTAAHQLAETCLSINAEPIDFLGTEIADEREKNDPVEVSEDMVEAVSVYTDYIRDRIKLGGDLKIEVKFDLSSIEPGMFGTSDAAINFDFLGEIEVVDYKHGKGVAVSPVGNSQLKYYGLGAARELNAHPDTVIRLTIVQPRARGEAIKTWVTTKADLEVFAAELKAAAVKTRDAEAKTVSGEWCKFCPAEGVCPALKNKAVEKTMATFGPAPKKEIILPEVKMLSVQEIADVLEYSDVIRNWLKAVDIFAFELADRGTKIPGYKLVQKRANRKWIDEAQAQNIFSDRDINYLAPPKMKTPAQIEAMKVDKNLVASLTTTPDNGLTLVGVEDKRPEANATKNIATMFGAIEQQ